MALNGAKLCLDEKVAPWSRARNMITEHDTSALGQATTDASRRLAMVSLR